MCGKRRGGNGEGERWEGDALVVCVGRGEMLYFRASTAHAGMLGHFDSIICTTSMIER